MQLLSLLKDLTLHPKNAEELRRLILQLAVQGKLTANWRVENPHVEPANVLLKKIEEEKVQLIIEKKINKEKPLLPIVKSDIPYKLPSGWEWCRLRDAGYTMTGGTPSKSNPAFFGTDIPFIKPGDIQNWKIDYNNEGLSILGKDNLNRVAPKGSILMVCLGTIGKCGIIKTECSFYQQINSISPLNVESDYLLCTLSSPYFYDAAWTLSTSTTIALLNKGKWEAIPIPLPPLEEQKEIVKVVNMLFTEVEQLEELTKTRISLKEDFVTSALQRLTQADNTTAEWNFLQKHFTSFFTEKANVINLRETILQLAVQGKLTAKWRDENPDVEPASELLKLIEAEKQQLIKDKKIKKEKPLPAIEEDEIPYELPEGWEWCRFQDTANIASNLVQPEDFLDSPHVAPHVIEKGTGVLLPYKTVREDKVKSFKHLFLPGQILYSKIRPNLNKLVMVDFGGLCSADMYPIQSFVDRRYLFYFMLSKSFTNQSVSTDTRVAMPKINQTELNKIIVSIPPLEEEKAIVERINTLMALCDELEQEIDNSQTHIEQLMQSCLKEVFEN